MKCAKLDFGNKFHLKVLRHMVNNLGNVPDLRRFKHVSAITHKKKILKFGVNNTKSHPIMSDFSRNVDFEIHKLANLELDIHSEMDAIVRFMGDRSLRHVPMDDIVVWNLCWRNGRLKNAKPCPGCSKKMNDFGIKLCVHT